MPVAISGDEGSSCCVCRVLKRGRALLATSNVRWLRICVVARRRRVLLATSNVRWPRICVVARRWVLPATSNVRQPCICVVGWWQGGRSSLPRQTFNLLPHDSRAREGVVVVSGSGRPSRVRENKSVKVVGDKQRVMTRW